MKHVKTVLSALLIFALLASMLPVYAVEPQAEAERSIHNTVVIDDDPEGGYEGDYVVIYNPNTQSSNSRSTGSLSGLIETSVGTNASDAVRKSAESDRPYKLDVDAKLAEEAEHEKPEQAPEATKESYSVGSKKTFRIYQSYSPTGSGSVEFKCLYVGQHCYIWTPTSTASNVYPLDSINSSYAELAAAEFDGKFDLMQYSFGDHTNGSSGDGKLHILYYNIDEGWQPGQGYVAGFFWSTDLSNNGLPMLNIDTYPGVHYVTSNGTTYDRIDDTYSTMVHEYQHLINYSNTPNMDTWLNETFSAAAEEICYPGSSVVSRIQSWENYSYDDNGDWLDPPAEFSYQPDFELHNGYSMYYWGDPDDILALYAQGSMFAQYLFTRFGNSIYQQISQKFNSSGYDEPTAITNATGVNCAELVRDFRIALTANAAQSLYDGVYGFKVQDGYDPAQYHNVQNPWNLLAPIVFTGASCSIKGGGAITVKPVNGVFNPPADASSDLQYYGVSVTTPYVVTAVSNNDAWGTVSVDRYRITATPAAGYYVAGYDVLSGTATATVNGNTILVRPESDCTVRVNFAEKPSCTVSFKVCGESAGSTTALLYDEITLPESVNVSLDGWSFSGWTAAQIPTETTETPVYYAPGATYQVTGTVTLHALFTRTEGSEAYFELLSAAPSDWTGNYVISYGTTNGMYLMKGVTVSSDGLGIENSTNCASYASAGVTLENNCLYNVADSYVFSMEPRGSYYSVQSTETGTYLGMTSSSYLGGFVNYTATSCDWIPGFGSNGFRSAQNGSYPYLSFTSSTPCFWSSTYANTSIRLWQQRGGSTTYYCTAPSATVHTHTPGEPVTENNNAPTCTAAGSYDTVVYCTTCGAELSRETTNVEALGHDWSDWSQTSAPTCTNAGEKTRSCSRCNTVETEVIEALGHDVVNHDAKAPTCTEIGWDAYETCSRCDYSTYVEKPALGHDVVNHEAKEPTCTESGWDAYETCSRCDYSTYAEKPALGHDIVNHEAKEPTCTESGWDAYETCSRCDYTTYAEKPALGHDYNAVVTEPSCTEKGYTTYTCSRCNDSYTDSETEALSHAWNEGVVTVEPKYQTPGEMTYTCTRCSETRTEEIARLANPFEDVHDEDFFFNPVMWALDETVTGGIDETHFAPAQTVMRADAMVFFWAANKRPEFTSTSKTFKDVKSKHWAYNAVMWAVENGITGGTDAAGKYFSPQRTCTRSEILQFLYAAMGKPEYTISNPYSDVKTKHWYYDGAIWAHEKGLEKGENGKFKAKTPCTRGYVVTYLYRFLTGNELAE